MDDRKFKEAAVPVRKTVIFRSFLNFLNLMDRTLLSLPFFRNMAWIAVVQYRQPFGKGDLCQSS